MLRRRTLFHETRYCPDHPNTAQDDIPLPKNAHAAGDSLLATLDCYNCAGMSSSQPMPMGRIVSFVLLLVIILLIGAVFLAVMAQFLVPMFLAVLLVVLFRPLHHWIQEKCGGRAHLAAGLTTLAIVLIVLIPLLLVLTRAVAEGWKAAQTLDQGKIRVDVEQRAKAMAERWRPLTTRLGIDLPRRDELPKEIMRTVGAKIQAVVAPVAQRTVQFLGNFLLGLFILLVSLYFFLADGPDMIRAAMQLSPLDDRYEAQLLDEFVRVSRAVVLATLLSAFGQGILAGFGYWLVGLNSVFLLTFLTMLLALVPFVGAAAVWFSCALFLLFYDRTYAAIFLITYGALVVSFADNVIKPYVLHGQSNLHPLLALLSVLGGIKVLGPIGIFVGPMVVAFLQALLNILRSELDSLEKRPATAT